MSHRDYNGGYIKPMATIEEKIAKLLKLAENNSNEHESAIAAAKVKELLNEHKLEIADILMLQHEKNEFEVVHEFFYLNRSWGVTWRRTLWMVVARSFFCRAYDYGKNQVIVVGRSEDIKLVKQIVHNLMAQFIAFFTTHELSGGIPDGVNKKTYRNNYLIGAVYGVSEKLDEIRSSDVKALMVITETHINRHVFEQFGGYESVPNSKTKYDHFARQAGRNAGKNSRIFDEID